MRRIRQTKQRRHGPRCFETPRGVGAELGHARCPLSAATMTWCCPMLQLGYYKSIVMS